MSISIEQLEYEINLITLANKKLDELYTVQVTYEEARVALFMGFKCTYGLASDFVEIWENKNSKMFER